jgi:hypothetical protein
LVARSAARSVAGFAWREGLAAVVMQVAYLHDDGSIAIGPNLSARIGALRGTARGARAR